MKKVSVHCFLMSQAAIFLIADFLCLRVSSLALISMYKLYFIDSTGLNLTVSTKNEELLYYCIHLLFHSLDFV